MQHLDLSDDGDVALGQDVRAIVENDRYALATHSYPEVLRRREHPSESATGEKP